MEEEKKEQASQKGLVAGILRLFFALLVMPVKILMKNPKLFLVLLIVVVSVGGTIYLARAKPELLGIQGQSLEQTRQETEKLVKEVGDIIVLPEGELPTVATVTDIEKVKGQTFFAKAQNGDKVLIYSAAKKAYLYRPSEKKVIEVGFVNLNQTQSSENDDTNNPEDTENKETEIKATSTPIPTPTAIPLSTSTPTINP